jgi:putative N6-adenine-specific DNA methylase
MFEGTEDDIARCNMWLRSADRLLVRLAEFPAADLDDIYEGVHSIPWADFLSADPRVVVSARSIRPRDGEGRGMGSGTVFGVPALQSVGKKAIIDALIGKGHGSRMEETGPLYQVEIAVRADRASVLLDTSGDGLHKRGYRREAGGAPLRETLAAGMVLLSRWDPSRPFADPLCGSGTIPIEAALIGSNGAPGASRSFAAENWPHIPPDVWHRAREQAASAYKRDVRIDIQASDRDPRALALAQRNAERAGISGAIAFRRMELDKVRLRGEYGCIVTNPPYAERIGGKHEVEHLYGDLGMLFRALPTWSLFALTAHPGFSKLFVVGAFHGTAEAAQKSRRPKNRKLYNGNIRCYYYQYYGPLPRSGVSGE